ncbi:MAG: glycosyl transferase [Methanosphaera sp.]|nr:glycosyl transferase [Methanosphaera sp.]
MRILITSFGVGIGHASRDLALARKLRQAGHEVIFASFGSGYNYLKMNRQETYDMPTMNFQADEGEINIKDTVKESKDIPYVFIKTMYKEARIIRQIKPDVIIADSTYTSPITAKFLNIPCFIITNDLTFGFSDSTESMSIKYFEKSIRKFIKEITRGCKKILIPDIAGTVELPSKLEGKTEYIGPLLHKNPDEIESKTTLRKKYNFNDDDVIILLTVGGSEFGEVLIKNICDISKDINCDRIIIFTGLEIKTEDFNINDTDKIIIKDFTPYLVDWMQISDLTIALAGHTTSMELISIKKPNILIPLKNHVEQQKNIENMEKYEITATTDINDSKKLLETINDTLCRLDSIKINEDHYNEFVKYDGKTNALKQIESLYK